MRSRSAARMSAVWPCISLQVCLRIACGKSGIELEGFELSNLGILGRRFTEKLFAVKLADKRTGLVLFVTDGGTSGAPFSKNDFAGLAALPFDVCIGRAAAVFLGTHDIEGIPHALHLDGMSGIELSNPIVLSFC